MSVEEQERNGLLKDRLIQLPKIVDDRGNLSFIEELRHIPFKIARAYWIYDVPGGEKRGSHAFREQEEFIVALSGSFDVVLDDGTQTTRYSLNRSYMGVYVPRMTWRTMENFSTNSLCLVLSSTAYAPADYIWDYDEFCRLKKQNSLEFLPMVDLLPLPQLFDRMFSTVWNCGIFELPKEHNRAGNLTALNNRVEIPFDVKRAYYLYDVPGGESRGGHAHRNLQQILVAASGCFSVTLDDGRVKRTFTLNRPYQALYVVPGIWRTLDDFSSGSVCLVLASDKYDEADYIRDYNDFLMYKKCK